VIADGQPLAICISWVSASAAREERRRQIEAYIKAFEASTTGGAPAAPTPAVDDDDVVEDAADANDPLRSMLPTTFGKVGKAKPDAKELMERTRKSPTPEPGLAVVGPAVPSSARPAASAKRSDEEEDDALIGPMPPLAGGRHASADDDDDDDDDNMDDNDGSDDMELPLTHEAQLKEHTKVRHRRMLAKVNSLNGA